MTRFIWVRDRNKVDHYINVDHIIPAGSLNTSTDLPQFVERLFCEQDNLQVLCEACHDKKTLKEKQSKKKTK